MKKIIICSISVFFVLILGTTVLVLALIPLNQNNFISRPYEIYISSLKTQSYANNVLCLSDMDESEKQEINKIYNVFDKGFEINSLSALLLGEKDKKIDIKSNNNSNSFILNAKTDSNRMVIFFRYKETQKININGYNFEFNYIVFEVDNVDERKEIKFALLENVIMSDQRIYYNNYLSGKANLKEVYKYLSSLLK